MPRLTTPVQVPGFEQRLEHEHQIVSVGSCFSEHMAERLAARKFTICTNPNGVLYNPASICVLLRRLHERREYTREELFEHDGLWHSFEHHGSFSAVGRDDALARMNAHLHAAAQALARCDWLLVTLGTAFAWYHERAPGKAVANCHRLPVEQFERRCLCAEEIVSEAVSAFGDLLGLRPSLRVILTVSPVRHLRHEATENSVSKAHLVIAVDELARKFEAVHRFPSYEIMMDELRDYRFCAPDLVHPSEVAQDIIWARFREACMSARADAFVGRYEPVLQALGHRPLHAGTDGVKQFAARQLALIDALERDYPSVDFAREREHFEGMIG